MGEDMGLDWKPSTLSSETMPPERPTDRFETLRRAWRSVIAHGLGMFKSSADSLRPLRIDLFVKMTTMTGHGADAV